MVVELVYYLVELSELWLVAQMADERAHNLVNEMVDLLVSQLVVQWVLQKDVMMVNLKAGNWVV